jgi:phosphatidylserine/phosphatidylglycerophosphate/cardiolipin synthase-like enzyme
VPTRLDVYSNGDDALLVWNVDAFIPECRGFAIRRELTRDGKKKASWIQSRVGFREQPPPADKKPRPTTVWPLQSFFWTDHDLSRGDSARYYVVPIVRSSEGKLVRRENLKSDWAAIPAPSPDATYQAFFNRGFVISQFISRYLQQNNLTLAQFKKRVSDEHDVTIRKFLSGDLRIEMLALLEAVHNGGGDVYAALYELGDDELVEALGALGARAHVVLSNGSIKHVKGHKMSDERKQDQNADARTSIHDAGVDVELDNRFISPGALGHNKFLVFTDHAGTAKSVWTGSTNWTSTGLCTQLNNGLLIQDPAIADVYLKQWHALRDAKSEFPPKLVQGNKAKPVGTDATVWFTRTAGKLDLEALKDVTKAAKHAILFLMFMPGGSSDGVLAAVRKRDGEPNLLVRGVASELPDPTDETVVDVTILGDGAPKQHRFDVIQPEGHEHPFAFWAAEVTHKQFLDNIGYAIVHSKVLVIDPLSDAPTLVTGSHNFSTSASAENDENFIIIRNQPDLARAYMVNVIGAWRHYRSRVNASDRYPGPIDADTWMAGSLRARNRESFFWGF